MGIMDILNGMQNGPRGESQPGQGGMSPITMAILGLLAWKAVKKFGTDQGQGAPPPANTAGANMQPTGGGFGGGLGGMFGGGGGGLGGLGGLLTGGAAGSVLSGGLNDLLNQFRNAGQGETADSWVSNGPNKPVSPNALDNALGDRIDGLAQRLGIPRNELLQGLSQHLPEVVNQLTPNGRVPTEQEMARHL